MTFSDYRRWLDLARKHSRRADEAEDLLQDALLIAGEEGRLDFDVEDNRRWFSGVLRNRAAMIARSEGRRREREEREGERQPTSAVENVDALDSGREHSILPDLPPAARKLATLILHGMTREEILFALGLSETAYRQRMVTIRKSLGERSAEFRADMLALAYSRRVGGDESLERGLIRQALLRSVRVRQEVGTHDPDGHLIMFKSI